MTFFVLLHFSQNMEYNINDFFVGNWEQLQFDMYYSIVILETKTYWIYKV